MESPGVQTMGRRAEHSSWFEWLTRAGFFARGVIYGIIGLLSVQVAIHSGGKVTDQRGALTTIAHQPFGHWLVLAVAVGLGGYAAWRFVQAIHGHGPEGGGDASVKGRVVAAGSGIAYSAVCVLAVSILLQSGSSSSSSPHRTTAGVLGWPGGRWIVGAVGGLFLVIALYQGYRGLTRSFLKDEKTERMGPMTRRWITRLGIVGYLARMVVFGLIGVFAVEAAATYDPKKAVGLDGALSRLGHHGYGLALLGVVAAGFAAFGLFSIIESRYRRI